jgi:hypothetical protein
MNESGDGGKSADQAEATDFAASTVCSDDGIVLQTVRVRGFSGCEDGAGGMPVRGMEPVHESD